MVGAVRRSAGGVGRVVEGIMVAGGVGGRPRGASGVRAGTTGADVGEAGGGRGWAGVVDAWGGCTGVDGDVGVRV